MGLKLLSDRQTFCYCKVRALKDFSPNKKNPIPVGSTIYAMLYPSGHWYLFNTTDESETRQYELKVGAVIGVDFEEIKQEVNQ